MKLLFDHDQIREGASSDLEAEVRRRYADGIEILEALPEPSEADTQDHLVAPILEALGYSRVHMRREVADRGNAPDRIVWAVPVAEAEARSVPARFVIEEKPLGADFERPRASRADTPSRQIQRYLEQHRLADDSTVGILTDGRVWRLYERRTDSQDGTVSARQTAEYAIGDGFVGTDDVPEFVQRLAAASFVPHDGRPPRFPLARAFLKEVVSAIDGGQPRFAVNALAGGKADFIDAPLPATGLIADARRHDWEPGFVCALGPEYTPPKAAPELPLSMAGPRLRLAAIAFRDQGDADAQRLRKGDVGLSARAFGRAGGPLLLTVWSGPGMRFALHAEGRTSMTPEFDPDMPPASALATIEKVVGLLRGAESRRTLSALQAAFDIRPLQRDFYARIESWLGGRMKRKAGGAHDMAMVRHLIRVLFAWILKEHGFVPRPLFDYDYIRKALGTAPERDAGYHSRVLSVLFHGALNRPENERDLHPSAGIDALIRETPFLNGSIFAPHPGDKEIDLPDNAYWNADREKPGLFDILEAFEWTLDEHSARTNDLALDPELLGALFERLVSLVDHSRPPPRRKPKGTYYTPRDVVAAMVSDALVARLLRDDGLPVSEAELRQLFSETDDAVPDWPADMREEVRGRLRRLTVFDPAVGSGVFLLGMIDTLMTAFAKLEAGTGGGQTRGQTVRAIIRDQLHGGDIQPLAAQIARLRLFLAIEAAEGAGVEPLPNLEARIVNADALGTVPDPAWRPGTAGTLLDTDPEFGRLLRAIMLNRRRWFDAHDEIQKERLLAEDDRLRAAFAEYLVKLPVSDEYRSFAAWSPLDRNDTVATTDPRLIFGRDTSAGFDIVIGNPPYGDLTKKQRKQAEARRYRASGSARIEALFVELAAVLAQPERGVVELVLPLGVSFRKDHAKLRKAVVGLSAQIDLRHYDMTPGRIFNTEPTAKRWPNKQRATLFTARRGIGGHVRTTGLRRWFEMPGKHERAACLADRNLLPFRPLANGSLDSRIAGQWLRIPTPEAQALVAALVGQRASVGDLTTVNGDRKMSLGLPHTAYQYVTTLPAGCVTPRREHLLHFRSEEDRRLALAALNGHVFYAWWLMVDDGFDVNPYVAEAMGVPDPWRRDGPKRRQALALAERLVEAIPACITGKRNAKTQWRNVDFFSGAPELVEELDRLQIASLGLSWESLIDHLRIMRSSSSWRLSHHV